MNNLIAESPLMRHVCSLVRQVAPTRATVLISGESGTGKEIVARTIHDLSPRRDRPFVAINCAALTETLMESQLFGHERGAFTGAIRRQEGCFELAQHGTLLLDEIGEMPPTTQAKLLRVLESSRVRRLGGSAEIPVDVRIIASTNRMLDECLRDGLFREDLYYRLKVFHIQLPPLRRRMEDLPVLCKTLLDDLNAKHGCKITRIEPSVMEMLQAYHWPGNVRELRNVLERASIIASDGAITRGCLSPDWDAKDTQWPADRDPDSNLVELEVGTSVDEAERLLILKTLEQTDNKAEAAEILGISLKTLYNKLKKEASASKL